MTSILCYFENIQLSGNREKVIWTSGMAEILKDVPLPPVIPASAQPQSTGERWVMSVCSLAEWEIFLVPTQSTNFWFPAHQFSSEIQAVSTLRNSPDQQQWICTEEQLFKDLVFILYTFQVFFLNSRSKPGVWSACPFTAWLLWVNPKLLLFCFLPEFSLWSAKLCYRNQSMTHENYCKNLPKTSLVIQTDVKHRLLW